MTYHLPQMSDSEIRDATSVKFVPKLRAENMGIPFGRLAIDAALVYHRMKQVNLSGEL